MNLPTVPENAQEDIPPPNGPTGRTQQVLDPEGEHRRGQDRSKLKFAFWLVAGSLTAVVILTVMEYFFPNSGTSMSPAIDTLKLVATTALGFAFGRTFGKGEG